MSEEKVNSIEGYQNTIELLKRVLQFYADKSNYDGPMGTIAPIDLDEHGSQARFALEKVKEIDELNEKMEKDYNAEIEALLNITDNEILNRFLNDNNLQ